MFVSCVCCVGSGLCDVLTVRSEESCRARACLCARVIKRSRNLNSEAPYARVGSLRHRNYREHLLLGS